MQIELVKGKKSIELKEFTKNASWFMSHYNECKKIAGTNKFIAIKNENPIENDSDMKDLVKKLEKKGIDPSSTFIGFINDENQVIQ
ncbi:MAG: hypothetical protein L0H53_08865 [Candidatus Nitrosocosmicus sp.]|nr:hypothetical protein [Candidatus Nitrosocosmicus sp.]